MLQVRRVRIALVVLLFAIAPYASAQPTESRFTSVTTLAGGKTSPPLFHLPLGVAVDPDTGNVYLADTKNHQIKIVASTGEITILAGSGVPGLTNGVGRAAQFHEPSGIVLDRVAKVLYVADRHNHVIRRVTFDGVVSRIAGTGKRGFTNGASTVAQFDEPSAVALAPDGSLYVADTANSAIRRVGTDGIVTTIAGTGGSGFADGAASSARFASPEGIAVRNDGAIVVSDTGNHSIRVIAAGTVTTIAGSGAAGSLDGLGRSATFQNPRGIACDERGILFITDSGNGLIRAFDGATVSTVSGSPDRRNVTQLVNGPVGAATFYEPSAIAFAGALYVADSAHDAIRVIHPVLRVDAVVPQRGPSAGGNAVRITGSGFMPGMTAVFGSSTATGLTYESSTAAVVDAPAGTGTVDVSITSDRSTVSLPDAYTYVPPPTIVSVNPAKGPTSGGQLVTVDGSNFIDGATEIFFGSTTAASMVVNSASRITTTTPPGSEGVVSITARTPGGETTAADAYRYVAPPTVSSFMPMSGRAGTPVTIRGSHFDPIAGQNEVRFGGVPAAVLAATEVELLAVVPANASTGRIAITTAGGSTSSAADFIVIRYVRVEITPSVISLEVGQTQQLQLSGIFADGTAEAISSGVTWSTSDGATAAIQDSGLVAAKAEGSATITGSYETFVATVVVTVRSAVPLPPDPATVAPTLDFTVPTSLYAATAFLYSGPNPIQQGVSAGTIQSDRVALLRGAVRTRTGQPLPGVQIRIAGHPEYGTSLSRADGMFDMVVNGGGPLTIEYSKDEYLPVERQVTPAWDDQRVLPDVTLITYDPADTTVTFGAASYQVARGSVVSDDRGTRRATLLFQPSTTASLELPDGTVQPAAALTIRATEYTVGSSGPGAMPAPLPPTSSYTYCVEVSADEAVAAGAASVTFNQPVIVYVENFIGFPTGAVVPAGYYDRRKDAWIPLQNGRVIRMLSATAGMANLDVNGDGAADSSSALSALGITSAERQQLAVLYTPGQSLWRVAVKHFTPLDFNWPGGPTPGAVPPPPNASQGYWIAGGERLCGWSTIDCENQALIENIPIPGTPYQLEYDSGRSSRSQYKITVNVSGPSLNADVRQLLLEIQIAGRTFAWSYAPQPNVKQEFEWDGKDAYGRTVQGSAAAHITLTHMYPHVYYAGEVNRNAFGLPAADAQPIMRTEVPFAVNRTWDVTLGRMDMKPTGFGGWSFSAQSHYDPRGQVVYLPDGQVRNADPDLTGEHALYRIAGTGECCATGEGGSAISAKLNFPSAIATAPDGSVYLAEYSRIRKVDRDGVIRTIAGTGTFGFSGDGGPATAAQIDIWDVAVGPDGSVYMTDRGTRIRRIDPSGIIRTVAGNGTAGESGDGGPATAASLRAEAVAVGVDGSLYIAARWKVRRVGPDGTITTIAGRPLGTGGGAPADGGLATNATLGNALGVALGPDGSVYISDIGMDVVRRVTPDGFISTIAGSVGSGLPPVADGASATSGVLQDPWGIAVGPDGTVFVAENRGLRIRAIGSDGVIRTIAGTGQRRVGALAPDGSLARGTAIPFPLDVDLAGDGSVIIADDDNVVRRVGGIFPATSRTPTAEAAIAADDSTALVFREGRHVRTVHRLTGVTLENFDYDEAGRLIRITDRDGDAISIERNTSGEATAIVAPGDVRTTLGRDAHGRLNAIATASGTHGFSYGTSGLLDTYTDLRRGVHRLRFDDDGRLLRDEDPVGGFVSFTADRGLDQTTITRTSAEGRATQYQVKVSPTRDVSRSITTAQGGTLELTGSGDGKFATRLADGTFIDSTTQASHGFGAQAPLTSTATWRLPSGVTLAFRHERETTLANGNPLSVAKRVDRYVVNDRVWTTTYDAASRTITSRSPLGRERKLTLNDKGRLAHVDAPGFAPSLLTYDAHGRLRELTAGNRTTTLDYNSRDLLSSITDSASRSAGFGYDAAGRATTVTLRDGRAIGLQYDPGANITAIEPPGRPAHAFTYTLVDQIEDSTAPGAAAVRYAYDKDRLLTLTTRPDVSTLERRYDDAGRLASIITSDGEFEYTYTAPGGQLQSIVTPDDDMIVYAWDGPLVTLTEWRGVINGAVAYTYDNYLRVAAENGIAYTYDADGLLTGAGPLTLSRDMQSGMLAGTTLGATIDEYTHNEFGEIAAYAAQFGTAPLYSVAYSRDLAGRITTKTEVVNGAPSLRLGYEYDPAGRLQKVTSGGTAVAEYEYDANGNRRAHRYVGGAVTPTYDDQDRLLTYGDTAFTYTANGELSSKTAGSVTTTYGYNAFGSLRTIEMPGGTMVEYVIDAQQRRIGKKLNGTLVQGWLYGDQVRIVAELNGSGTVVSQFIYGSKRHVPEAMIRAGVLYRIISDNVGSPRLIVNASDGSIAQRIDYNEFGMVVLDTNPGFQPFGFAGGLYDRHSGLVRFGARDYDPETGRWTTKEPLGFAGGDTNFYAYALSDPVNYFDPDGLQVAAANHPDEVAAPAPRTFVADLNDPALSPLVTPPYPPASQFYGESHQCVAFTKHFAGLPCTDCWRAGQRVAGNNIPPGTAIATFDANGRYPQTDVDKNSGIFLFPLQTGFVILDQWPGHTAQARRLNPGRDNPSNNSDAYSVITVPPGTKSKTCNCGS